MSTQTVDRFASIDDTAFDVYEIRGRLFDTLNAIDPLLWIDLMNCDRLRGCPSYAAELLALDCARAIERKRPQTAEVLARFYHTEVRPFLNGYYLGMFDPQFPAKEEVTKEPAITEEMMLGTSVFQGDETVNLHTIPNGAQSIITGYSLSTPNGYALFGIRKSNERVRIEPAYVPTLEVATQTLVRDAFAYAARPATPAVPAAAAWESFESSCRRLSHGGWFVDEDGEVL